VVPDHTDVIVSSNRGEPLVLSETVSTASIAFSNIARRLQGEEVELLDLTPAPEGFFTRLLKLFRGEI
jgi:septum site-determining protein MinD